MVSCLLATVTAAQDRAPLAEAIAAGARALAAGDAAGAVAAFERAVEEDDGDATAWLGLSAAAEATQDWLRALEAARRAVALAPERSEAHLALARLLGHSGRAAEALVEFERTRELAPELEEAYLLPALLLRDADRDAEALELLEQGWARAQSRRLGQQLAFMALAAGDAARALAVVETALAESGEDGDLLLAKALALSADPASREEGASWFERALAAGVEQEGPARLEWARLLADLQRWPEAVEQLEAASVLLPETAEVFYRLAAALRQTGDLDAARMALVRYQELNAADVAAERRVRELGTALNEAQELAAANRLAEALLRLDAVVAGDTDPRVAVLRAKILYSLDRGDEALAAAQRARTLAPTAVEPAYLTALFAFAGNRIGEALEAIEQVLSLEPGLGEAWALHGSALARSSRLQGATESFERALALGFDSAALRLDYAGVLSDLGRAEESRGQLEAWEKLQRGEGRE